MYEILAILAGFTLLYSTIAGRVERTWVSGPILFVAFGAMIGPLGFGMISKESNPELLKTLAEMTLALVLFTDAAGTNLGVLRRVKMLPVRLLAIGLPLTILLGFGVGKLVFGSLAVLEIALIATMLAPTDAALGKAVVTNEAVPPTVREGLNVESGLNDGICVPILLLFLTLAQAEGGDQSLLREGLSFLVRVVGIGLVTGVLLTGLTVWILRFAHRLNWLSPSWGRITVIGLTFTCFGVAQMLGGSGFIASFTGGMLFGALVKDKEALLESAEGIGDTFSLLTWVLFGAAVIGRHYEGFTWPVVLYALLSLTVVRMLPVFLVLLGTDVNTEGKLFIGWFGPRGLASIVFVVITMDAKLPHIDTIVAVVACTILMSVVLHGVTANPWAKAFGARQPGSS